MAEQATMPEQDIELPAVDVEFRVAVLERMERRRFRTAIRRLR
jgi:hypothetical protein